MPHFDLKQYLPKLKQKKHSGRSYVFDPVRKKNILLQPEELVRQLFIQYLIEEKGFSTGLMQVEKMIKLNQTKKRFDIVVYDRRAFPRILVECKEYGKSLDERAFRQIAAYNLALRVDYMIVTNGWEFHCFEMDYNHSDYHPLAEIPALENLS